MSIDFESQDGRTNYLNEKLDNLLSGVNASYGQTLLDELVTRLQRTITDFNDEVSGIMDGLKESSDRRNQIIHDLMDGKAMAANQSPDVEGESEENGENGENSGTEMSAWEKRLEGL